MCFIFWPKVMPDHWGCQTVPFSIWTFWCFSAPLELRNSRLMLTMDTPFQTMFRRFSSVTFATGVASRFSSLARAMNLSTSSGARATAMRSWLSLMASSVPSRPSYFLVTLFRSMYRPSASSPMATDTPPAPKSLQRLIIVQASSRAEQALQLALDGGVALLHLGTAGAPGCPALWALEEPVAPPHAVAAGAAAQQDDDVARGRGTRGGRWQRARRPRPRRSPCAWPHSRGDRSHPP